MVVPGAADLSASTLTALDALPDASKEELIEKAIEVGNTSCEGALRSLPSSAGKIPAVLKTHVEHSEKRTSHGLIDVCGHVPPHMPPCRSEIDISPEARAMWYEHNGAELEAVLESGAIALLDSAWVIETKEGAVPNRRQDLPPEAFITLDELRAIGHVPETTQHGLKSSASLPIIAIS